MMPSHAVEEDRLTGGIGENISGESHLFQCCSRAAHRNQNPGYSGFGDDLGLCHVLRIVGVDSGEGHDGLDPLARDDRAQRGRLLPGPSD